MGAEEWETYGKVGMFKEILKFKKDRNITGFSIMEVIIMYCEEVGEDIDDVGALLRKDKNFVETLEEDLKFNHEAVFSGEKTSPMAEWI